MPNATNYSFDAAARSLGLTGVAAFADEGAANDFCALYQDRVPAVRWGVAAANGGWVVARA